MTAAPMPSPSKAAQFADAAETLGWVVTRERLPEGGRLVQAERDGELYEMAWHRNTRGTLVYAYGDYYAPGADEPTGEVTNVKAALRDMAKIRSDNGALLPFNIRTDDDALILAACAGRTIKWRNSMSGLEEAGDAPRGGFHFKITGEGADRVLHFPDKVSTGFRSVRLSAITEIL